MSDELNDHHCHFMLRVHLKRGAVEQEWPEPQEIIDEVLDRVFPPSPEDETAERLTGPIMWTVELLEPGIVEGVNEVTLAND